MKILAKTQPETKRIISIPPSFAIIKNISENAVGLKTYTYSISLDLDVISAVDNNITFAEIDIYPNDVFFDTEKAVPNTDNTSQEKFILNIQESSTQIKQKLVSQKATKILTTRIELLPHINVSLYEAIKLAPDNESKLQLLPLKKVVKQQNISKNNVSVDDKLGTSFITKNSSNIEGNLRLASVDFLLRYGDVAKFIETQDKNATNEFRFNGTNIIKRNSQKRSINDRRTDLIMNEIRNSIKNSTASSSQNITTTQYVRDTHVKIIHTFEITSDQILNVKNFNIDIKVFGKKVGLLNPVVIQRDTNTISHADAVNDYNAPKLAPTILMSSPLDFGKNSLQIIQNDSTAEKIRIYSRSLNKHTNFNDQDELRWKFIGQFNAKKGDIVRYVDETNNNKTVSYRAVSIGKNDEVSMTYDAVVIPGKSTTTRAALLSNVTFYVLQNEDFSKIIVTNVQNDIIALTFKKRNKTVNQAEYSVVGQENERVILTNRQVEIIDFDVSPDNVYEYICICHKKNGISSISNVTQIYQHKSSSKSSLKLTLDQLETSIDAGEIDVKFRLNTSVEPTKLDNIKMLLEQQGLYELFKGQVFDEKSQLSNLLCHHVKRFDNTTGEYVSFGIVTDEIFSDRTYGRRYNIQPPINGRQYTYIVTSVLRDIETVFEEYEKVVTSKERITGTSANPSNLTTQQYINRPAKYRHPLNLRLGTLTSELSRKQRHGFDELLYGEIGNETTVNVTIDRDDFDIENFQVQIFDEYTNIVSWNASGDITNIDYYILSIIDEFDNTIEHIALHQFGDAGTQTYLHNIRMMKNTPIRYVLTAVSTLQKISNTLLQMGPIR